MTSPEAPLPCYTYMVRCNDGTLYTGWTNDLKKRLAAHNSGRGAKYTAARRPVTLVYAEQHEDRNRAMQREYTIKHLTRQEKENLIGTEQNILTQPNSYA